VLWLVSFILTILLESLLTIHTGIRIQLLRERDQKCLVEDPGRAWRDSDPPIRKSTSGGSERARSSRTASQWSRPRQADKNKAGSGWHLSGNTAAQHSYWLSIRTIIILTVITDRKCSHCETRNCKGSTKAALEAAWVSLFPSFLLSFPLTPLVSVARGQFRFERVIRC